jgi:hypothetical protein
MLKTVVNRLMNRMNGPLLIVVVCAFGCDAKHDGDNKAVKTASSSTAGAPSPRGATAEEEIEIVFQEYRAAIKNCDGEKLLELYPQDQHEELASTYALSAALEVDRDPGSRQSLLEVGLAPDVLEMARTIILLEEPERSKCIKDICLRVPNKARMISAVLDLTEARWPVEQELTNLVVDGERAKGTVILSIGKQRSDGFMAFVRVNGVWKILD